MQEWTFLSPFEAIVVETFIAFLLLISVGFIVFAKGTRFSLWSKGWVLYLIGASLLVFHLTEAIILSDVIGICLGLVGPAIMIDGIKEQVIEKRVYMRYLALIVFGIAWFVASVLIQAPLTIIYIPPAFLMAYACIISVREILKVEIEPAISIYTSVLGLFIIVISEFLAPLMLVFPILDIVGLLQATGIIMTGTSMLVILIRLMDRERRIQFQISQLMSRVLQHDIRNYIQITSNAIQLSVEDESQSEKWLSIATEAMHNAGVFVDEIRGITVSLYRGESTLVLINLHEILTDVIERVKKIYDIQNEQIHLHISGSTAFYSNQLVRELLWNIVDNSFKHGSINLTILEDLSDDSTCTIKIIDTAGGLPPAMKEFLNNPETEISQITPGMGLGLGLIKGLTPLSGARLNVTDHIVEEKVVGTAFSLTFKRFRT